MKTGILLLNIGTPEHCTLQSVKRYLKAFLSDPYVVDLPSLWRYFLVHFFIVPFRAPKTLKAYQKIWQPQGSPLRFLSEQLKTSLAQSLGRDYVIAMGMQYSTPSIQQAVGQVYLSGCQRIIVVPLFPQFAQATTTSCLKIASAHLKKHWRSDCIEEIPAFYHRSDYIEALASPLAKTIDQYDHILFSFHGLPKKQIIKIEGRDQICPDEKACPAMEQAHPKCYRAQCFATARSVAKSLNLPDERYTVSFQSRLGRIPWIQPYTDETLVKLAQKGIKKLAVLCPSFVVDCLETLEEIGIQAKVQWRALGGEVFTVFPCLNHDPKWVAVLVRMILSR